MLALAVPAWSLKKQLASKIDNLPASAQACAPPNPDAVFGLARSLIYSPEDVCASDIIAEKALQAIQDSIVDAEMKMESEMNMPPSTPTTSKPNLSTSFNQGSGNLGEATPLAHKISSDDEDLAPQRFDFEGASGVMDHPEATDPAGARELLANVCMANSLLKE